jgi:hypothetical protein
MSAEIRRWAQCVLGAAIIVYALFAEKDAALRWKYAALGALLFDPEHVLKAIGLWKGSSVENAGSDEVKP